MENDIEEMNDLDTEIVKDEADSPKSDELSASAKSSDATDGSNTEDDSQAIDVVRDVVGKREEPAAASSASDEETGQETGDQPKEQDDEQYSDVPFNKHPRFQRLLNERNSFKQDAVRYQNVQGFLDQNGIGAEEAAELLTIGGLIKTNPAEAWRRMQPTVQHILIAAGEVLPDDLKSLVQSGQMSADAALEVSRSRAQVQSVGVQRTFEQQQAQRRQLSEQVAGVQGAVQTWEADRREKDPNFEAKLPALQREVAYLHSTEGRPNTPEGVKAQLKKAYDAVNATFVPPRPTAPQPRAVTPVRGGQVAGNARPKPQSTLDIINSVVAQRQA